LRKRVVANARYVVIRAGKKVAHIRRSGRSDWLLYSVHCNEKLNTYRNLDAAHSAAVARTSYPDEDEVYEAICKRVEQQRRTWKRREQMNVMFDLIQELATGERGAGDRLVLLWRGIESFAKDRLNTGERDREWLAAHPGVFRHGVRLENAND
jgi:hypothetical protein